MTNKNQKRGDDFLKDITLEQLCGVLDIVKDGLSFWPVRREEIQRFVEFSKAVYSGEDKPTILDVGCGNGFLSYLLAETGEVKVVGIDPDAAAINNSLYQHPNLRLEVSNAKKAAEKYKNKVDVVFNSWMPLGVNLTPEIRNINAKAIIYVKEIEATGIQDFRLIDQEDKRSYEPGKNYRNVLSWQGPTFYEIQTRAHLTKNNRPLYLGRNYNCNIIEVQLRNDLKIPELEIPYKEAYPWEAEMQKLGVKLDEMTFYRPEAVVKKHNIFRRSGPRR